MSSASVLAGTFGLTANTVQEVARRAIGAKSVTGS